MSVRGRVQQQKQRLDPPAAANAGTAPQMAGLDLSAERAGAFEAALATAEPGACLIYHVGAHCAGPHRVSALAASDKGQVYLIQRKLGPSSFAYMAIVKPGKGGARNAVAPA